MGQEYVSNMSYFLILENLSCKQIKISINLLLLPWMNLLFQRGEYSLEESTKIRSGIDYALRCYLFTSSISTKLGCVRRTGDVKRSDWKAHTTSDEKCDNIIHNSTVLKEYYNNSLCPFIENDPIGQYGDSPQKEEIFFAIVIWQPKWKQFF
jgi:hypothetical protein